MAAEYQRWIKVANDLGLGGDELRTFVKDRQEEAKAERTKVEETEREARKLEAEREARKLEADTKKLEAEREARKLETEREARKLEAEREAKKLELEQDAKKLELEAKKQEQEREERKFLAELEAKRISEEQESRRILAEQESKRILAEQESRRILAEQESLERIKLRELEIRFTIEQGNAERQNFLGQGDVRTEHIGTIRDVQMPLYEQSEDLDIYLNRFELICSALKISKDLWVLALIKSLKGQALEVHERMRAEDAKDYEKLKIELLNRFRLTEGGYWKKFKGAVREKDETTPQDRKSV